MAKNTTGRQQVGKAALKSQMRELKSLYDEDPGKISLGRLDQPQVFRWVLTVDECKVLDTCSEACLAGASKAEAAMPASSSGDAAKKRKKKGSELGKTSVMKFF